VKILEGMLINIPRFPKNKCDGIPLFPGYELICLNRIQVFRIEFMYKAHYMMISYRPELGGIWRYYGISRGLSLKSS
jgi:hypothetical protein